MQFEWDEHKRATNVAKHGLDFPRAASLFDGRPVLHVPTDYPAEARFATIGELEARIVVVVWTWRDPAMRLISARMARKSERRLYRQVFPA